ncbi:hypothetical protein [Tenacibaculum piscium]|uniref:hypothetical protein n=1 Tax=Tenacibaculum piscium TaxID=1458515 RepID=UPI001F33C961|nr:hypothetical protein [Tenacibaculum piscium]
MNLNSFYQGGIYEKQTQLKEELDLKIYRINSNKKTSDSDKEKDIILLKKSYSLKLNKLLLFNF